MNIEWRTVVDFEYYEVSNEGGIRSVNKTLTGVINDQGYYLVCLIRPPLKPLTRSIHTIVWDAFGSRPREGHLLQIDHIDHNKLNNNINNLQLLSNRKNTTKGKELAKHLTSSRYIGVSRIKSSGKIWKATIDFKNKQIYLGIYFSEKEASDVYQDKLKQITERN